MDPPEGHHLVQDAEVLRVRVVLAVRQVLEMQEAKNAKKKCRIFVNPHARMLCAKAKSLKGYVTMLDMAVDSTVQMIFNKP